MTAENPKVTIYTDGGCRPNPGPGGWAAVILAPGKKVCELVGAEPETTNNRMELQAAIEALAALDGPHDVELVTDSQYLRRGVTEWLTRWQASGWQTAQKTAVKNRDLWRRLADELARHRVVWRWTRGHSGDRWNERADRLAAGAIARATLPLDDMGAVHLFLAAAYSGKAGAGGWAVVLRFREREKALSGRSEGVSANRMHLQAAVAGLAALKRPSKVHLYTTSDYLKDGATSWVAGWESRGWRTKEGKPVSHRDLWQKVSALAARHRVTWHVVSRDERPEPMERAKQDATLAVKGKSSAGG